MRSKSSREIKSTQAKKTKGLIQVSSYLKIEGCLSFADIVKALEQAKFMTQEEEQGEEAKR